MTEKSPSPNVIEVLSDEETYPQRRHSIVEVLSDEESEVEIVAIVPTDDVQITGHQQLDVQPLPPIRNFHRRVRPRRNPENDMVFMDFHGDSQSMPMTLAARNRISEFMLQHLRAFLSIYDRHGHDIQQHLLTSDEVSNSIMARLDREDDLALDRRIAKEDVFNLPTLRKKQQDARTETSDHTSNITPETNLMCELCGVILGEGIPTDFEPDRIYDDHLEQYAAEFRVNAPWFCIRQCFDTDIELSKRVFAAKCGHVFCGRCIKNIGNRPRGGPRKGVLLVTNPQISAPRKCPAEGCGAAFTKAKRTFTEVFI